jgi:glycine hydroxymethyltransferase
LICFQRITKGLNPGVTDVSGSRIRELVERHEEHRAGGLCLIASETCMFPDARKVLSSDLAGRYHAPWYGGTAIAREMIRETERLVREAFNAEYAIVTPLSGNVCDLAAVFALTEPGDAVGMIHFRDGGYPLGLEKFHRRGVYLPVDADTYEPDVTGIKELIVGGKVKLTILGSSFLLFPHPVREVSQFVKETGHQAHCVFDGSHGLGLIATGAYPNPLDEGAEVLFGSTHKTLCGPQGGLVVTNSKELYDRFWQILEIDLDTGIGLVDNPHVNRVAALGVTLEGLAADPGFGKRVVENSKAMAGALDKAGVPLRFKSRGFTETHQVLMDITAERAEELCRHLDASGIFIDVEGRIGTQEATHRGMGPAEMEKIAGMVWRVFDGGPSEDVKREASELAEAFPASSAGSRK